MNSVLFIDVDEVMSAGIRRRQYGGDERVSLAEHLGDRITEATYSWDMRPFMLEGQDFREVNEGLGKSLEHIRRMVPQAHGLTIVALTRSKSSLNDVREAFADVAYNAGGTLSIDEVARISGDALAAAREYLGSHADLDIRDYAILTRGASWYGIREHCVQSWGLHGGLSHTSELLTARLLLEHAPWYEWANTASVEEPWGDRDPYGSDRYDKVVLLDIDGVLNDEGPEQRDGVYVNPQMVDNLARIVEQTGAAIVLTSTWKYSYLRFARDGFETESEPLLMLQRELDRCGLRVDGMTPSTSLSGPLARPLEIMEWLRRYWRTNAYVILEDDTFWEWGWLRNNVVTTQTVHGVNHYGLPVVKKGLTEKHALRSISILKGHE